MSCLFNSLAKTIQNTNGNELRKIITEYLKNNPILYDDENTKLSDLIGGESELSKYINNMEKSSTWGGAIEIKAFCDIFNAIVKVKVLSTNKWIEFIPQNKNIINSPIFTISWNGNHFESI
jgi:hypothetical protein